MPTLDDVRAIALSFPETIEKVDGHRGGAGWRTPTVCSSGSADPARPTSQRSRARTHLARRPRRRSAHGRTRGQAGAARHIPGVFFTIPHFDGYPAVLVRLDVIEPDLLREVITDAWILKAPEAAVEGWLAENG